MTGVIYARYSSDNQREESIEGLVLNKVIKVLFDDEALDKIANEIVALLDEDKLVITFNFKNEPITVPTSDELEAIGGSSDIEAFASQKKD